jgi:hypothetical protein
MFPKDMFGFSKDFFGNIPFHVKNCFQKVNDPYGSDSRHGTHFDGTQHGYHLPDHVYWLSDYI